MNKQKFLEIYVGMPNGSGIAVSRRPSDGVWWVEVKQPHGVLTPVLLNARPYEAVEWFSTLTELFQAQGHDPFPDALHATLAEDAQNLANPHLRAKRELWRARARAIEFRRADGQIFTLLDAMSVWFWDGAAEICLDPISAFGGQFMDATGRTVEQVAELRREVELIARGLRWEIRRSKFDTKRVTYSNEHARWAEWRDVLVS